MKKPRNERPSQVRAQWLRVTEYAVKPPKAEEHILTDLVSIAQQGDGPVQFRSLMGAHQYKGLYRLFRRYLSNGAEVLDWGAGNGHFSYYLVHSGYVTTGFSPDPCALQVELPEDQYLFVQGDALDPVGLPFPDRSFDAVASVGTLEHVRESGGEELKSLREIRRVLRPGGWLICYHLPNRHSILEAISRGLSKDDSHQYRFTRGQVITLLRESGLKLWETHRYGFLPRNVFQCWPNWIRSSHPLARFWDYSDVILSILFAPLCQNHLFVARRPFQDH